MVASALIGEPPLTEDDFWVVRGNLLSAGLLENLDPANGLQIPPQRPPPDQYEFQTRGPVIIAVCSLVFAIMFCVTVARLLVRQFKKDLKFGLDDWLILPALVRCCCSILPMEEAHHDRSSACHGQSSTS